MPANDRLSLVYREARLGFALQYRAFDANYWKTVIFADKAFISVEAGATKVVET